MLSLHSDFLFNPSLPGAAFLEHYRANSMAETWIWRVKNLDNLAWRPGPSTLIGYTVNADANEKY